MNREEALKLLRAGPEGVAEWNRRRKNGERIPSLHKANLDRARLIRANLSGINFSHTDRTKNSVLSPGGADLIGVDSSLPNLNNLGSGASFIEADLSFANLSHANLRNAHFGRANLRGTNFCDADGSDADFNEANFTGAALIRMNLSQANLCFCSFVEADMTKANLTGAILAGAILTDATLQNANLDGAKVGNTSFDCELREAIGLGGIVHNGQSPIPIQSLIGLKEDLPDVFLRGCGLQDEEIEYFRSRTSRPIRFYSCFISYSHADKAFARRLHDTLQGRGIRCWLDEHQMLPGDKIHVVVNDAIRLWDKVLLCASKDSLTSWWVDKEITAAMEKEKKLCKEREKEVLALIPLNLDGYLFSDEWQSGWKNDIKSRLAADFTGWENDNAKFDREFEKVVRAMKTDDGGREKPPKAML